MTSVGYDVDERVREASRRALAGLRASVAVRDYGAEVAALRAEVHADELARLKASVREPERAEWRRRMLSDPAAQRMAELGRIRSEVREVVDPHYGAMLASARRMRARRERVRHVRELVASCLLPGSGDLSRAYDIRGRLETGLREAVKAGDRAAEPLLASLVASRGREMNAAITASGYRPTWRTVRTRDGHVKATREHFYPDGTVQTDVRYRYRGQGDWLTPGEFRQRVAKARERDRQRRRQIPAVGRPRRR